jgi:hypothetical protein
MDFLSELRDCLPLKKTPLFPNANPRSAFKPQLTELGFYLLELFSYSRTITVTVGWYCPQDRQFIEEAAYFCAGAVEFRPRPDRTLNKGKWLTPVPGHLIALLRDIMRKACPGTPLNLLSEEGQRIILDGFKWTALARMSNKQARQARVSFAKKHPELLESPKELARAMRKAQLYSKTTSMGNILDHIGSIIDSARG